MRLGDFLSRNMVQIDIEDSVKYRQVTVRMWNKGVCLRDEVLGSDIKSSSRYLVKEGQFIISKIDARHGAFGMIPKELEGAVITADFLSYNIDSSKILPEYFHWFFSQKKFTELCAKASAGTTNRIRLKEDKFLDIEIEIPSLPKQNIKLQMIKKVDVLKKELRYSINRDESYVLKLRQAILSEAILGKLMPQNHTDESANVLLTKIKTKKEQLIMEKKLRQEKPLPPIKKEDSPFEIPRGWLSVRLGDIVTIKGGKRVPNGTKLLETVTPYVYIRVTDMKKGTINTSDLRYVQEEIRQKIKPYIIKKEDLYITIAGTIGQVGTVPELLDGMNLTENAARIINYGCNLQYLRYCLSSSIVQDQFVEKTKQMAQPKLALIRIQTSIIPLPPLTEQERIVTKVTQLMSFCDELESQITQNQEHAEVLMNAVLREAFLVESE